MLLWHYTSVDVLSSIFATSLPTLRASNVLHLNDSAELKFGLDVINSFLKNVAEHEFVEIRELLHQKMLKDSYDPDIYSFSLSESEDSLYQWLAYCPSQGGVALGFELPETTDQEFFCVTPKNPGSVQIPQYRKCHYFSKNNLIQPSWIKILEGKTLEPNLLINAMFLKHEAFHFEKEHRLFFHLMSDDPFGIPILFQGNKPFINFHFYPEILKKIYISPRGDKELTERTTKKLLTVKGLGHVTTVVSDIPFRE